MISARNLCFLILLLSLRLFGQQEAVFRTDRLTTKDGLSHRWTLCVYQDLKGFMWVGTYDGLNRYDGNDFIVYRPSASGKFPVAADLIYEIAEYAEGKFLINTGYGILKFDAETAQFELILKAELNKLSILLNSGRGVSFLTTGFIYKGGEMKVYEMLPSGKLVQLSESPINSSFEIGSFPIVSNKEFIWFWNFKDSYLRFNVKNKTWSNKQVLGNEKLPVDKNGDFLMPYGADLHSIHLPKNSLKTDIISFNIEPGKAIWFYSRNNKNDYSLLKYNLIDSSFKIVIPKINFSDIIYQEQQTQYPCQFEDKEGSIWFAGFLGILKVRSTDNLFKHFMAKQVTSIETPPFGYSIRQITEDNIGNIYVVANNNKFNNFYKINPANGNYNLMLSGFSGSKKDFRSDLWKNGVLVYSMTSDRKGIIWYSTAEGIFSYDPSREAYRYYDVNLPGPPIIYCDFNDVIFYGYLDNNYLLNKISGKFILGPKIKVTELQNPVGVAEENTIWFLSDIGLLKYNSLNLTSRKIQLYDKPREQRCFIIHKGWIWLGTSRGLEKVNPKTFVHTNFDRSKGLPGNFVYSMVADGDFLWLGTSDGLCRFNIKTEAVKNFFVEDGLSHNEFNTLSAFKSRNGKIFMGGLNGINAFFPADLEGKTNAKSSILLSRFSLFDAKKDSIIYLNTERIINKIELSSSVTSFNIHLALTNYIDPAKNQYAWRMVGLDPDWFYAGNQHIATYRYIPPGHYTFRAKAADSFGNWTEKDLILQITVLGPWYNRWWAWLFYIIAVGALAYILYRFQLSKKLDHAENLRLQELDEFKNRFFTNITHEFRTPLTVILGMSGKLQDEQKEATDNADSSRKNAVSLIKRNAESLLRLINQILDLAKLESHSLKINYVQADVLPYLRYITQSLQSFANTQNILLRVESEVAEIEMDYDPERLLQIVHNLLSNAIKFTPDGGRVTLTITIDHLSTKNLAGLKLKVEDTGPGIPEADIQNIFDRFYQANNLEKAKTGGTGIGLSLTKELVHAMGGDITVKSETGKGSVFTVRLPITHEAEKLKDVGLLDQGAAIGKSGEPSGFKFSTSSKSDIDSPRILIVEDNPDVVEYIASCLQNIYQLGFAYNGRSGIGKALESTPDLILSDVMMPEKDGFEVCDFLKNDERTSHIPIILLTAKADIESRLAGLRKGADAYLSKPFNKEELLLTIQNLLESRRKLQAKYALTALEGVDSDISEAQITEEVITENEFLKRLRAIIEENLSESNMDVDAICRKIGMGRTNLHNKLSALTGLSTTIYLRKLRLQKAKELLLTTEMNVSEVAYEVGFNDPKFFSRVFAEEYGVPPSEMKKK